MSVKRYQISGDRMFPAEEGHWVWFDDYDRLRRELASACHQIELIRDLILRHKGEQTADVRQVCSNMDAIIWAWAEDREGDLPPG